MCYLGENWQLQGLLEHKDLTNDQHQLLDMIWNWQLDCVSMHQIECPPFDERNFTWELWPFFEVIFRFKKKYEKL